METTVDRWILEEAASVASLGGQHPRPRASLAAEPAGTSNIVQGSASDEMLMHRFQRGNEAAFRQLYDRHRSSLLRFVQRLAPAIHDAEEIAQETWMAVIKGRERYLPRARFVTYLFSIARRRTMDRWRSQGRSPLAAQCGEDPEEMTGPCSYEPEWCAGNEALGTALLVAISALPILQREAFLLRAEGGLSIEEIAQVTGTNPETAKSRLRYALGRLRISMESWQ